VSRLPEILSRRCALPVEQACDGVRIRPGRIYIAPSGRHLTVSADGTLSLNDAERLNVVRPSADVLFSSVAESYGKGAIGVVLTGTGSDGAHGALEVKRHGGTVIAQDRTSSAYFGMPDAAIKAGAVDAVLPLADIAAKIDTLVHGGV
jgi:two-component system chemotaxis response regulator CheB